MVTHGGDYAAANRRRVQKRIFESEIISLIEKLKKSEGKLLTDEETLEKLLYQLDHLNLNLNRGQAQQVYRAFNSFIKRLRADIDEIRKEERAAESWITKLEKLIVNYSW